MPFIEFNIVTTDVIHGDESTLREVETGPRLVQLSDIKYIRPSKYSLLYVDEKNQPTKFEDDGEQPMFTPKTSLSYLVLDGEVPVMILGSYEHHIKRIKLLDQVCLLAGAPPEQQQQKTEGLQAPAATGINTVGQL